ncbi:MAG: 2-amino-4-hydroxy-6-hydroxymethyldihydropteridine diphosphokinase [Vulcanococcus sp.]
MRASLADQPGATSLAIALGANLPGPAGSPIHTLVAVRPQLEALVQQGWPGRHGPLVFHWSPLFTTAPVGGPADQPPYGNAVLVVEAVAEPAVAYAQELLQALHQLEQHHGRERRERWGPRSLDLDLLWWGDLQLSTPSLALPHPLWPQRGFVLAPLLAIERRRGWPIRCPQPVGFVEAAGPTPLATLAAAWRRASGMALPQPLPPPEGWPC